VLIPGFCLYEEISKCKKVKIIVQMFFMKESLITRSRIENVIRPYSTTHGNNIKAKKT
jgi:carbon monoxide dehydrogenase subunit G